MRQRATVRRRTGATSHVVAGVDVSARIVLVEIEPADGAYLLLYLDDNGTCVADTWHQTREAAMAQAKLEFEIEDADWELGVTC